MKYIIAVDQSTSGTKVALFDEQMNMIRVIRKKHAQFYPNPGYVEHDAEEIWQNTIQLLLEITNEIERCDIAGIGIANQRETTVLWDRSTGKPVCRAIVWQDVRAKDITDSMCNHAEEVVKLTGLYPSPYYSAAKAASVLRSNPELNSRAHCGELCIGTIDSYLLYRLTNGKQFATDVSNAGRTQLLNIQKLQWDAELARIFDIPSISLADDVLPCDATFGSISNIPALKGVSITAMMGDSNASLFGHGCTEKGMVKASYGTGSSVMMNIGNTPIFSKCGLSASIGYSYDGKITYVLEGNVTCSADTLVWLRDSLHLINDMSELRLASEVSDTNGVYLIPAFSGLGAPWFDENARAMLCGMSRGTEKKHVLRAALASIAHQNADILDTMQKETGIKVFTIHADGGGSINPTLMQMQSDYVPCHVIVPAERELTLRGVGIMAGLSAGVFSEIHYSDTEAEYTPKIPDENRCSERNGWKNALKRCR